MLFLLSIFDYMLFTMLYLLSKISYILGTLYRETYVKTYSFAFFFLIIQVTVVDRMVTDWVWYKKKIV